MQGVVHYNPHVSHQTDFARAFANCGFKITTNRNEPADVHVIYGPHYCLHVWRKHTRVIYIDRAWWGHDESKPGDGYASIGWLNPDGSRRFATGTKPRPKPEYESWKTRECSALILAGYDEDVSEVVFEAYKRFTTVNVRKHPANRTHAEVSLEDHIRLRDVIICNQGTAGFEAIIQGKPLICLNPQSELLPVACGTMDGELYRGDRDEWLHDMSYKQWSLAEIASGEVWQHLKDVE